jgi:hypothetical protein
MAKKKKSRSERTKLALRRLAEDEEVQAQLRTAAIRLREAWARAAARRPRSKAVEDKKLYAKVREAATSLTHAGASLRRPPQPPKRRGRKVALTVTGIAVGAYVVKRRGSSIADVTSTGATTPDKAETRREQGAVGVTG